MLSFWLYIICLFNVTLQVNHTLNSNKVPLHQLATVYTNPSHLIDCSTRHWVVDLTSRLNRDKEISTTPHTDMAEISHIYIFQVYIYGANALICYAQNYLS